LGKVMINITNGGVAPFQFRLFGNNTWFSDPVMDVPAGTFRVAAKDSLNRTMFSYSGQVYNVDPMPVIQLVEVRNVTCFDDKTGLLSVAATGGLPPYSFVWNRGGSTNSSTNVNLSEGSYSVTVSDGRSCKASALFSVSSRSHLKIEGAAFFEKCPSGGSINVTASGGVGSLSFNWSNGAASQNISALPPGIYNVSVKDSLVCIQNASFLVSEPTFQVSIDESLSISCDDSRNFTAVVFGGLPPYSFLWNNGATRRVIEVSQPGLYSVTVVDSRSCVRSASRTKTSTALSVFLDSRSSCLWTAFPSGGLPPFRYAWSTGSTNQSIANLTLGSYAVVVMDGNNCSVAAAGNLTSYMSVSLSRFVNCSSSLSTVFANVVGGAAPFRYIWSGNLSSTSQLANVPLNGTYSVQVEDQFGCRASSETSISTTTFQFSVTLSQVTLVCGSIVNVTIIPIGGTPPYRYFVNSVMTASPFFNASNGQSYIIRVSDANNCNATTGVTAFATPCVGTNFNRISVFSDAQCSFPVIQLGYSNATCIVGNNSGCQPGTLVGFYSKEECFSSFVENDGALSFLQLGFAGPSCTGERTAYQAIRPGTCIPQSVNGPSSLFSCNSTHLLFSSISGPNCNGTNLSAQSFPKGCSLSSGSIVSATFRTMNQSC